MKEKLLWVVVAILGLMLAKSHAQSLSPISGIQGRYQLVVGPNNTTGTPATTLYRIDTATGRTWVEGIRLEPNNQANLWFVILEPTEQKDRP